MDTPTDFEVNGEVVAAINLSAIVPPGISISLMYVDDMTGEKRQASGTVEGVDILVVMPGASRGQPSRTTYVGQSLRIKTDDKA